MIEGSGSGSDADPYLLLMDPDLGGPKTYGSYGSGSAAILVYGIMNLFYKKVLPRSTKN
jgi:hypothetical protein